MSSGVYLVSSKPTTEKSDHAYDNPQFTQDKVKYSGANGVEIPAEDKQISDKPFRGMGKEELLRYSQRPFWRRLRMVCISIVVVGWLALIIAVVALVLIYPRCKDAANRSWWQKSLMYRIYVPSFKDSNGDGIGDLKGIESQLDYIQSLGVGVISISPIYENDDENDFGITNHTAVDPVYGNRMDMEELIKAVHDRNMYLVLDFIPNLTSDKHRWFLASHADANNDMKNYYVWQAGTNVPNNWVTVYSERGSPESAWTMDTTRNEYYLHQFLNTQPDLNLRSSKVQGELMDILTFWLEMGVDGFYVRHSGYLFEDFDLRDDPSLDPSVPNPGYSDLNHKYTYGLPEVVDMLNRWRSLLRHYSNSSEKVMVADTSGDSDLLMSMYGDCSASGVQIPVNEAFTMKKMPCGGSCIADYVDYWMNLGDDKWPNWMAGNEDTNRIATRFNDTNFIRVFNMLTMLLPGTPVLYYGDEINMVDSTDVINITNWGRKQVMRSLMQWQNGTSGGFCPEGGCNTTTWIGVNDDVGINNVAAMSNTEGSLIKLIKELTKLRQETAFQAGFYSRAVVDSDVFSFVREFDGTSGYLVAINFGSGEVKRDYTGAHDTIQETATVSLSSSSRFEVDDEIETSGITLGPLEGVVVSWDYVAKEL